MVIREGSTEDRDGVGRAGDGERVCQALGRVGDTHSGRTVINFVYHFTVAFKKG